MKVSQGIFRYGLYFFIGAWMFALGIIVGRGTSPVTFDTQSFQERLRVIVGDIPKAPAGEDKVDLVFFNTLKKPVAQEPEVVTEALIPPPDAPAMAQAGVKENEGPVPVKVSRKLATRDRIPSATAAKADQESTEDKPSPESDIKKTRVKKKTAPLAGSESGETTGAETVPASAKGRYTIQVAAYKAFKDSVTQMSLLKEKGFTSYRTRGEAGGTTWYRVRTGSFKDFQSAQAELNRLKQAKINGMIIKKDDQ